MRLLDDAVPILLLIMVCARILVVLAISLRLIKQGDD
jgi:hypothetical protein